MNEAPMVILLAGPNGAVKSTFYEKHLSSYSLPFINADVIAKEQGINSYEAAQVAENIRLAAIAERQSYIFETVLSDPHGAKIDFLRQAQQQGYEIHAHFIGLASPALSQARVIHRVASGGHDVPDEKIFARYQRVMDNLARLLPVADHLTIYDNSFADTPHRPVAYLKKGLLIELSETLPAWITFLNLPSLKTPDTIFLP